MGACVVFGVLAPREKRRLAKSGAHERAVAQPQLSTLVLQSIASHIAGRPSEAFMQVPVPAHQPQKPLRLHESQSALALQSMQLARLSCHVSPHSV